MQMQLNNIENAKNILRGIDQLTQCSRPGTQTSASALTMAQHKATINTLRAFAIAETLAIATAAADQVGTPQFPVTSAGTEEAVAFVVWKAGN